MKLAQSAVLQVVRVHGVGRQQCISFRWFKPELPDNPDPLSKPASGDLVPVEEHRKLALESLTLGTI